MEISVDCGPSLYPAKLSYTKWRIYIDKHAEIRWQNHVTKTKPSFGTINLTGEGGNYQCSILGAFKAELSLYL